MKYNLLTSHTMAKRIFLTCLILLPLPTLAIDIKVLVTNQQQEAVKDVVVYLEPLAKDITLPKTSKTVNVKQLNKAFAPYVSVMQLGNKVLFDNQDDITHHIYSPVGENKFEFKLRAGNSETKEDFNTTGEVVMGCNIHDWMSGYLLILDTPYFNKSNNKGIASLEVETTGEYNLVVWHPQLEQPDHKITQQVTITKNSTFNLSLGNSLKAIPKQSNDDDFDFLSDY